MARYVFTAEDRAKGWQGLLRAARGYPCRKKARQAQHVLDVLMSAWCRVLWARRDAAKAERNAARRAAYAARGGKS